MQLQTYVALKLHEISPQWSNERKENFVKHAYRENQILQSLDHERIVKCYDVSIRLLFVANILKIFLVDNSTLATVLEYCDGGDLEMFLSRTEVLDERTARCILIQIFRGLRYLNGQKQKIIHYDLKPSNILFHKGYLLCMGVLQLTILLVVTSRLPILVFLSC
jgi:tousled-like kinase